MLIIAAIFFLSSQSLRDTGRLSSQAVKFLRTIGIKASSRPLRHYAHYVEYGILGIALAFCFHWHAIWIGSLIGLADETYKIFRLGREFDSGDLIRDIIAVVLMTIFVMGIRMLWRNRNKST